MAKKAKEKNLFRDSTVRSSSFLGQDISHLLSFSLFFDGSVLRSSRRNRKSATRPDKTQKDIRDYYEGSFADGDDVPRQHQTLITKKRCLADDDYGGDILV